MSLVAQNSAEDLGMKYFRSSLEIDGEIPLIVELYDDDVRINFIAPRNPTCAGVTYNTAFSDRVFAVPMMSLTQKGRGKIKQAKRTVAYWSDRLGGTLISETCPS